MNSRVPHRPTELRSDYFLTPEGDALLDQLGRETDLSRLTLRICVSRGLRTKEQILDFLNPSVEKLSDPFRLRDMDRAVDRLEAARANGEFIRIYGDYDVDGTTGAALLLLFFRECGYRVDAVQPDRFKDGYGLHPKAIEQAVADGVQVLVTVDCGITSFAAADRARELGLPIIILDHHAVDPIKGIPDALAVVDAQRPDCESGLKELCGCGVAFYLCRALRSRGRERGWWAGNKEPNLRKHLDLVVIATAADMVPLTGDNHILVKHGMDVLKTSTKPGVRSLLTVAGLSGRDISPSHLGFTIGPRINASGRMATASIALELLTTADESRAAQLAHQIEEMNQSRMKVQNEIWDDVRAEVERGLEAGLYRHAIVVGHADWHEGVVGIVASKVTEHFQKPAIVLSLREDHGKGSVRSFGGRDVLEGLRRCSELLLGFGGHKYAAGLSLAKENVGTFIAAFDAAIGELGLHHSDPPLLIDGEALLSDFDVKTLLQIEKLGPFGPGNPEPLFRVETDVVRHTTMKERHLKLLFTPRKPAADHQRTFMDVLWFNGVESSGEVFASDVSWIVVPELNRFRGNTAPQLRVKSVALRNPPAAETR